MPIVPRQDQNNDVEPITVVDDDKSIEKTKVEPIKQAEACWNCKESLDDKGDCAACGFKKSILENTELNAQRSLAARQRMIKEGIMSPAKL